MQVATKPKEKINLDIELLLRWAYVDELSKRQSSAAEGIWDRILDYTNHGGVDSGRGAAQRYAHFGLPDPDAERVELAVSALGDTVIDWDVHFEEIAGDLAGLVSINDLSRRHESAAPRVNWGAAGKRALKGFFGENGAQPAHDRPRDVLMMGGVKTRVLVTSHAVKGTRPGWRDEQPVAEMTMSHGRGGTVPMVVGECRGRNLYTTGSYCPLTWSPSPLDIITGRADYFAWYQGLLSLCTTMELEKFAPLLPNAPRLPWIDDAEAISRVIPVIPTGRNYVGDWGTLPLVPQRPRAGPPRRRERDPGKNVADPFV